MTSPFKRLLVGKPLASSEEQHQRLGKPTALAVFASDAISSTAYATEEMLLVLLMAVTFPQATNYLVPISVAAVILLAIVSVSYIQTVRAYPDGGGAYVVSRENIGRTAALGGRCVAPRRLHAGGRRLDLGRRARHRFRLRLQRQRPAAGRPGRVLRGGDVPRQPARRQGVRQGLRRPHLLLRVDAGPVLDRWLLQAVHRRPRRAQRQRRAGQALRGEPRPRGHGHACSSCCGRSAPAPSCSRASRPSPTACRRSRSPSRATRRRS